MLRSDEQKMISNSFPADLSALYVFTSDGVKPRHGPHQCAEK